MFGLGGMELLVLLAVLALAVFGVVALLRRGSGPRSAPTARSGHGFSKEQRTVALVIACFVAAVAFFGTERVAESAGGFGWGASEIGFVRIVVPVVALVIGAWIYGAGGKSKE
jgi:hypothetical protein